MNKGKVRKGFPFVHLSKKRRIWEEKGNSIEKNFKRAYNRRIELWWDFMKNYYIDIHNHILPGVDDGAKSEGRSIRMLKFAAKSGIREIIATPHFHYRWGQAKADQIRKLTAHMQEALDEKGIPIRLHTGNELYYTHDLLEILKAGEVLTLADSNYVLLEFSESEEKRKVQNAIYQFLCEGYYPIIAHTERYEIFREDRTILRELEEMGAYFQVNASSLCGKTDWRTRRFSRDMMKNGLVSFVATDAHDLKDRSPKFGKSISWMSRKYGEAQVKEYLVKNPRKIITNTTI